MDWKIWAVILVSLGIVASAFIVSSGSPSGYITFPAFPEEKKTVFSADLTVHSFSLDAPAELLTVDFKDSNSSLFVGADKLDILSDTSSGTLILEKFKGKIAYNGLLTLVGTAEAVSVNGVRFKARSVRLESNSIEFRKVSIDGVSIPSLSVTGSGTVNVDAGKYSAKMEGETLESGPFSGKIDLSQSDTFYLSGSAARLHIGERVRFA